MVTGQSSHHFFGESHARLRHRWYWPDWFGRGRRTTRQRPHRPRSRPLRCVHPRGGSSRRRDHSWRSRRPRRPTHRCRPVRRRDHLAFSNDFSSADAVAHAVAEETAALLALGETLVGTDRPLVTVSGTPSVPGAVSTENDPLPTDGLVGGRGRTVNAILGLAARGVRSTAIRLPRTVHNQGNGGFAGLLTQIARQTGVSGYPGDGAQRWPAVHALDAAVLFRLALESAPAGPPGTPSQTRATQCVTSPPSSAGGSVCRSSHCRRRTSARSARSSGWTSPRPVLAPGKRSSGSRPIRASSKTWRTSSAERR